MQYRSVTDGNILAYHCRILKMRYMNDDVILYVRILSDADALNIAADHNVKPDADIFTKHHIADDPRSGSKKT